MLDVPDGDLDAVLRTMFPTMGDKPLVDEELVVPPPPEFVYSTFAPYTVEAPIDWSADPYGNNSWRFWFQNLGWLWRLYEAGPEGIDAAAYVVVDWVENALYRDPALEWTWGDHALASRLGNVSGFLDRYIESRDVLNRRVVHAAAQLIAIHVYALAMDACYARRHNHGFMQDLALLMALPRYPSLRDGDRLWSTAETRLLEQVAHSVTADGIHTENSPHYQIFYSELLTATIDVYLDAGKSPPGSLVSAREGLLRALVHLLQPNHTVPQFGDSPNDTKRPELVAVIDRYRAQGLGDPSVVDQLEWVLSNAESGTPPAQSDRVFDIGGYAAFRRGDSTGHLTCGRKSFVHYHQDETSIEIYGYGQELIVDPGIFGHDYSDPLAAYQKEPRAHNLLVVDGASYGPLGEPGIIDYAVGDGASWVQCEHQNYAAMGIASVIRTFGVVDDATFFVVDHAEGGAVHDFEQHFHLHPSLSAITRVDASTVVASAPEGSGPSLVFVPGVAPDAIEEVRGEHGPEAQGWYFPEAFSSEASTDLVLRYAARTGEQDFPVLIVLVAPAASAPASLSISYTEAETTASITIQSGGDTQAIAVPTR